MARVQGKAKVGASNSKFEFLKTNQIGSNQSISMDEVLKHINKPVVRKISAVSRCQADPKFKIQKR